MEGGAAESVGAQRWDEGKVQAKFYLHDDVYEAFKQWVKDKHGGSEAKGLLSYEVENAIVEYAGIRRKRAGGTNSDARVLVQSHAQPHKVAIVKQKVADWLKEKYGFYHLQNVHINMVQDALAYLFVDKRTQTAWMKRFIRYGVIKPIDQFHVEFV